MSDPVELYQPQIVIMDGQEIPVEKLIANHKRLQAENDKLKTDAAKALDTQHHEQELYPYRIELVKLQRHLERTKQKVVVLFEGRNAAGKGDTIRRMTRFMNSKHYRIVALGKPDETAQSQWFFQRYVTQLPRGGEIVFFDGSWYSRALIEPAFGFCSDEEYEVFMKGVNKFENNLILNGTTMVKIYLSVSRDEQVRRFERRRNDPLRQWKMEEVDLQTEDRWADFTRLKYEMLKNTNNSDAPWTVIRADQRQKARVNIMKVILNSVDYEDRNTDLNYVPDYDVVISGAREFELMSHQRKTEGSCTS